MLQLLFTANAVPSLPILLSTLMIEVICSSETSLLTRPHGVTSKKTEFLSPFVVAIPGTLKILN
jgi:hypothetical protein